MAKPRIMLVGLSLLIGLISMNASAVLTHRYDFNADPNDSIGTDNGTLINNTSNAHYSGGQLILGNDGTQSSNSGSGDYVDLPNGMISANGNQATFEFWVTWGGPETTNWEEFMSFGTSRDGEDTSNNASSTTYIMFTPRANATDNPLRFGYRLGSTAEERTLNYSTTMPLNEEKHVVATWDGAAGVVTMYVDGQPVDSGAIHFDLSDTDVMEDNNNWLGRSQWPDVMFVGSYNEFRIYNHALGAKDVESNYDLGPEAMPAILVGPDDGVNINAVSTTLEWQPAPVLPGTLTNYDIYLAKEGDPLVKVSTVPVGTTTYPTGILDTNSTYNWRIDQVTINDPCTVTGTVWSFDTLQTLATLTGPEDTRVKPTENAEFTVAIDSDTTVTGWQWKMVADPDDIDLNAGAKYDVSTSQTETTLTVKNVDAADVGEYYCVVTNSAGDKASGTATLGLNLTVAHYVLENNPVLDPNVPDVSGSGNDGFAYGVPALVPGLVGSGAFDFDGADNVEIPVVVRDDFTMMAWVKTTQTISNTGSGWWTGGGIVNGEMPGGVDDFGMQLLGSKACVAVQNVQITSDTDINDGEWHHMAFTRDSTTGQIQVFVDGRMEAQATSITGTLTAPTNLQIGKQQTGAGYYIGLIDDVIIADYVMGPLEIADVVYTVTDEHVCTGDVEFDFTGPEGVPDCIVNLFDFAAFAQAWLNCNFYPECFQ